MSRTAKRTWQVDPGDDLTLARSLAAVQVIGEYIGGVVQTVAPSEQTGGRWLFTWQDLSTDDQPLRPAWVVPVTEDPEVDADEFDRSTQAVELVTEFIGGAFQIGALRENRGGEFVTVGRAFQWQSYMPALEPAEEVEPESVEQNGDVAAVAG